MRAATSAGIRARDGEILWVPATMIGTHPGLTVNGAIWRKSRNVQGVKSSSRSAVDVRNTTHVTSGFPELFCTRGKLTRQICCNSWGNENACGSSPESPAGLSFVA